jgi:hypothetical protein
MPGQDESNSDASKAIETNDVPPITAHRPTMTAAEIALHGPKV